MVAFDTIYISYNVLVFGGEVLHIMLCILQYMWGHAESWQPGQQS